MSNDIESKVTTQTDFISCTRCFSFLDSLFHGQGPRGEMEEQAEAEKELNVA